MSIKHLNDAIEDYVIGIAVDVYAKRDEIYQQASEGLLDDDHEQVDMNAMDIIIDMVKEEMK